MPKTNELENEEKLTKTISIRLTEDDFAELEAMAELQPAAKLSAVAREIFRRGLKAI